MWLGRAHLILLEKAFFTFDLKVSKLPSSQPYSTLLFIMCNRLQIKFFFNFKIVVSFFNTPLKIAAFLHICIWTKLFLLVITIFVFYPRFFCIWTTHLGISFRIKVWKLDVKGFIMKMYSFSFRRQI